MYYYVMDIFSYYHIDSHSAWLLLSLFFSPPLFLFSANSKLPKWMASAEPALRQSAAAGTDCPEPCAGGAWVLLGKALRWWAPVKWLVKKSNITLGHRPEIGDKVAAWRCAEPALRTVVLQVEVPFPSWFWKQKVWRSLRLFGANFDRL